MENSLKLKTAFDSKRIVVVVACNFVSAVFDEIRCKKNQCKKRKQQNSFKKSAQTHAAMVIKKKGEKKEKNAKTIHINIPKTEQCSTALIIMMIII